MTDPKNKQVNPDIEREEENNDEGYDILSSNGPGLAGDDGEQIVDDYDEEGEFEEGEGD